MKLKHLYKSTGMYDIICCQTDRLEKRLSISTKNNEFNISDEGYFGDEWNEIPESLECPNCGQKVPDHIMLQLKLLKE